jgi:hypothetical protein
MESYGNDPSQSSDGWTLHSVLAQVCQHLALFFTKLLLSLLKSTRESVTVTQSCLDSDVVPYWLFTCIVVFPYVVRKKNENHSLRSTISLAAVEEH